MMENVFYFMLKDLFVLNIFEFWSRIFGHIGKGFDKKAKVSFKIYDVTSWIKNRYNTHNFQYLMK